MADRMEIQMARLTSMVHNMFATKPLNYKEFCLSDFGFKEENNLSKAEILAKKLDACFLRDTEC